MRPPVLGRRIVAPLAVRAREGDDVAHRLVHDLRDPARAHRPPTLPNREPQLLLHADRLDQLDRHRHVVPRHHHLHPRRQRAHPRHVRRPQVKLRPIHLQKRRVPPPPPPPQPAHIRPPLLLQPDSPHLCPHPPPLRRALVRTL